MNASMLVWPVGSLCSAAMLRLLNIATVMACGTGAVATISRRGCDVLAFWLRRVVCRLILKWRRLLMMISFRLVNRILLPSSVRALMMTLVRFEVTRSSVLCCAVVFVDLASSMIRAFRLLFSSALVRFNLFSSVSTEVRRRRVRILAGVSSIVRFLELMIAVTVNRVIRAPLVFILLRSSCRTGAVWVTLEWMAVMVLRRLVASVNGRWRLTVVVRLLGELGWVAV